MMLFAELIAAKVRGWGDTPVIHDEKIGLGRILGGFSRKRELQLYLDGLQMTGNRGLNVRNNPEGTDNDTEK